MKKAQRDLELEARLANAEMFHGFPDDEDDFPRPQTGPPGRGQPGGLRGLVFRAIRATRIFKQMQEASAAMRRHQTEQASGKVLIVRDVPYVQPSEASLPRKQMLDVYLPAGPREGLPLVIHFHGGGWVRGDRRDEFRGAPAVARTHAAAGCVVVAPSYRLGSSESYMKDAQQAVMWAYANAKRLGADPDRLYLSGHSAGGNIATLLAVGPWLAPPALPAGTIKGVIGMSGVYTLLRPLGGALHGVKNRLYDRMYRLEVFGDELATLARYSPTALLRLASGASEPFRPKCPMNEAFNEIAWQSLWGAQTPSEAEGKGPALNPSLTATMHDPTWVTRGPDGVSWAKNLPPIMLLNASWDLGLEDDAAYFASLLAARTGTKPAHHIIPSTNHTTVSWDETAFRHCRDFIAACENARASGEATR